MEGSVRGAFPGFPGNYVSHVCRRLFNRRWRLSRGQSTAITKYYKDSPRDRNPRVGIWTAARGNVGINKDESFVV